MTVEILTGRWPQWHLCWQHRHHRPLPLPHQLATQTKQIQLPVFLEVWLTSLREGVYLYTMNPWRIVNKQQPLLSIAKLRIKWLLGNPRSDGSLWADPYRWHSYPSFTSDNTGSHRYSLQNTRSPTTPSATLPLPLVDPPFAPAVDPPFYSSPSCSTVDYSSASTTTGS
jgi:hypothetical protein